MDTSPRLLYAPSQEGQALCLLCLKQTSEVMAPSYSCNPRNESENPVSKRLLCRLLSSSQGPSPGSMLPCRSFFWADGTSWSETARTFSQVAPNMHLTWLHHPKPPAQHILVVHAEVSPHVPGAELDISDARTLTITACLLNFFFQSPWLDKSPSNPKLTPASEERGNNEPVGNTLPSPQMLANGSTSCFGQLESLLQGLLSSEIRPPCPSALGHEGVQVRAIVAIAEVLRQLLTPQVD